MDWLSLLLPFAYLGLLVGSLYTFSHLYRTRKAAHARSLAPWFGPHLQRNMYLSLLELSSTSTKVPDGILKAALLRRATEDIHRILALRLQKPALGQLLQRGSVGDELWQRFQLAEKEMEVEYREVLEEANALQQGWQQTIFQSASEAAHNELLRKKIKDMEGRREREREQWARERENVRQGFLKELEGDAKVGPPAANSAVVDAKKNGVSSEDDAVIVDSAGVDTTGEDGTTAGGGKKRKNKK